MERTATGSADDGLVRSDLNFFSTRDGAFDKNNGLSRCPYGSLELGKCSYSGRGATSATSCPI
jgi:hypothetical protein